MNYYLLLKGLIIGFSIAAPVGPIGLLCINNTMQKGKLSGFLSGMGAACADMVYGCIAAFGLTAISNLFIKEVYLIKLFGGLFLCYLGIKIFLTTKRSKTLENKSKSLLGDYFSTFLLTITNPMTILSFTAVFAGLGIMSLSRDILNATLLVLGVFVGSALWWLLLSYSVEFINKKSKNSILPFISKASGLIILCFGIFAITSK
jgi:threonine/homoserine/homoserine lactone efflux protein